MKNRYIVSVDSVTYAGALGRVWLFEHFERKRKTKRMSMRELGADYLSRSLTRIPILFTNRLRGLSLHLLKVRTPQ